MKEYIPDLLIFTDGSVNHYKDLCGSGAILFNISTKDKKKKKSAMPGTNNVAELKGLELALIMAEDYPDDTNIFIISDSKYSIEAIERFSKYHAKNSDKFNVYKTEWCKPDTTTPYKNQKIIKNMHRKFLSRLTNVKYMHLNSHLSVKKKAHLEKVINKCAKQGYMIDEDTAKSLILANMEVDVLAKEACK